MSPEGKIFLQAKEVRFRPLSGDSVFEKDHSPKDLFLLNHLQSLRSEEARQALAHQLVEPNPITLIQTAITHPQQDVVAFANAICAARDLHITQPSTIAGLNSLLKPKGFAMWQFTDGAPIVVNKIGQEGTGEEDLLRAYQYHLALKKRLDELDSLSDVDLSKPHAAYYWSDLEFPAVSLEEAREALKPRTELAPAKESQKTAVSETNNLEIP